MLPRIGNGVGPGGSFDLGPNRFGPKRRKSKVDRMNESRIKIERKSIANQDRFVFVFVIMCMIYIVH